MVYLPGKKSSLVHANLSLQHRSYTVDVDAYVDATL